MMKLSPQEHREAALMLRQLAELARKPDEKKEMLAKAEGFEALAKRAERIAAPREEAPKQYEVKRDPLSRLDKIANRAVELLKEEENPKRAMKWAENRLLEENLFNGNPNRKNPREWAEQVIAQNPDLTDSLPYLKGKGLYPEKAETFEELILSLIPSEGGL